MSHVDVITAIPLIVEESLVLDEFKGAGIQEGEQTLPEKDSSAGRYAHSQTITFINR